MLLKARYLVFVVLIIIPVYLSLSCQIYKQKEKIILKGFDSKAWQKDKRACITGYRARVYDTVMKQEDLLKGLDSIQVKEIFGEEDIFGRKVENTFAYFYESGFQCTGQKGDMSWLIISFDREGIFRGIFIEIE